MQFIKTPNFDWLGKKWYFIVASFVLSAAGMISLLAKGGPNYGIDFRGGTLVQLKFREAPPLDRIRAALGSQGLGDSTLQRYGPESSHEILIGLGITATDEKQLDAGRRAIVSALLKELGGGEKINWNEAGSAAIVEQLQASESFSGMPAEQLQELAQRMVRFRDSPPRSGLISSFEELRPVEGMTPQVVQALDKSFSLPSFVIRSVEIVGPKVGAALRRQAVSATLLGLASMLVYIAVRFEWIYGLAAVVATFHDIIIAVGLLSLFNIEISLTVIAALLTLIGYSSNDTIVVFDRIRENVRLMRRERFTEIANRSINQTLSRTILTGGLTFVAVLALFFLGGEVLRGFAFTLAAGILVGTYSSIGVASTLVASWQEYVQRDRRGGSAVRVEREPGKAQRDKIKAGAKA